MSARRWLHGAGRGAAERGLGGLGGLEGGHVLGSGRPGRAPGVGLDLDEGAGPAVEVGLALHVVAPVSRAGRDRVEQTLGRELPVNTRLDGDLSSGAGG